MNLLMLVCAGLASLALGVLVAYALCRAAFALLRMHARSIALAAAPLEPQAEPQVAQLS